MHRAVQRSKADEQPRGPHLRGIYMVRHVEAEYQRLEDCGQLKQILEIVRGIRDHRRR